MILTTELSKNENLSQYEYSDIAYCTLRLREAGYIETIGQDISSSYGRIIKIRGLTYSGHLFLDNIRDNQVWAGVKKKASVFKSTSINILAGLAEAFLKEKLGLGN
jgi:hypothetical protein